MHSNSVHIIILSRMLSIYDAHAAHSTCNAPYIFLVALYTCHVIAITHSLCTHLMPDPGHRLALFHKHKRQAEDDDATTIHPADIKQRAKLSAESIPEPQDGREKSHYQ